MLERKAEALQQGLHDALSNAAGGGPMSFVDASESVDGTLNLVVGHSKRDNLARSGLQLFVLQMFKNDRVGQ